MRRSLIRGCLAAASVLALAACATMAPRPAAAPTVVVPTAPGPATPSATACATCGRIERIEAAAPASGTRPQGAVLGGVVGGVLAGPAPAKAAPAKGPVRTVRLVVLLDSGRRLILTQAPVAGMRVGSRVRVERSRAVLLR